MKAVFTGLVFASLVVSLDSQVRPAQLVDGTRVRLRLVDVITSETSLTGDPLEFVVARAVVQDGNVLIQRGTRATGRIVIAQPVRLGSFTRPARLEFQFDRTMADDGQTVRLRASTMSQPQSNVVVDRARRHHRGLQWADAADLFDAFVEGDYQINIPRPKP